MKKTSRFKQYLLAKEILMIPVAHDPLCATIIERAGFKVVGCGGYANSAALLGAPDIELLTLTEMNGRGVANGRCGGFAGVCRW